MQQLSTNYQSIRQKILYKSLLKTIQLYLMKNSLPTWLRNLKWLATGTISHYSDGKIIKDKELQCIICKLAFQNNFAYILHLELLHREKIRVYRYECERERTVIYFEEKGAPQIQYFEQDQATKYYLTETIENRIQAIIGEIMRKFIKKHKNREQRKYYHSSDIFRQVGRSSEDQDSQTQIGYVERELQKCRISEFSDVGESDKLLFQHWNNLIHEHKKKEKFFDSEKMGKILVEFAQLSKRVGIKRVNLLTHTWTLWSFGKISPIDVTVCMTQYDKCQ